MEEVFYTDRYWHEWLQIQLGLFRVCRSLLLFSQKTADVAASTRVSSLIGMHNSLQILFNRFTNSCSSTSSYYSCFY